MWQEIDSYPSIKPSEPSPTRSRRGSILSLFTHGKDKNGRDVLYSGGGDPEDWNHESGADRDHPSKKRPPRVRLGSILGMFTWGKDKQGRDVIHSGPSMSDTE